MTHLYTLAFDVHNKGVIFLILVFPRTPQSFLNDEIIALRLNACNGWYMCVSHSFHTTPHYPNTIVSAHGLPIALSRACRFLSPAFFSEKNSLSLQNPFPTKGEFELSINMCYFSDGIRSNTIKERPQWEKHSCDAAKILTQSIKKQNKTKRKKPTFPKSQSLIFIP